MYSPTDLDRDLQELQSAGAAVYDIGYTVLGRRIPCVFKGNENGPRVVVQAAIHAREWATTPLVVELMRRYGNSVGLWCVPMVDVDGVLLCQEGLSSVPDEALAVFLLEANGASDDFSLWKANARAVDLNVNFNAEWGRGAQNVTYPAPSNYIGKYPFSEPENVALRTLTERLQPQVTLSFHARGNVAYWGFGCVRTYGEQARQIASAGGYSLLTSEGSAGGYKDWHVTTTHNLGLTLEIGNENTPYDEIAEDMAALIEQNAGVFDAAANAATAIYNSQKR